MARTADVSAQLETFIQADLLAVEAVLPRLPLIGTPMYNAFCGPATYQQLGHHACMLPGVSRPGITVRRRQQEFAC